MEMTSDNIAVSDIILSQFKVAIPSITPSIFTNLGRIKSDNYTQEELISLINIYTATNDQIREFLLKERYIEPKNSSIHQDILTEKGEKANQLGGHLKYVEWAKKEARKKKIEDFPKKWWFVYDPIKGVVVAGLIFIAGWFANELYRIIKTQFQQPVNKTTTAPPPPKP